MKISKKLGFVYHKNFLLHKTGYGHPERPARLSAILDSITADDKLMQEIEFITPVSILPSELELIHTKDYIKTVKLDIESGLNVLSTGDTSVCKDSWDTALLACGAVKVASDFIMQEKINKAFCALRPPGHHAKSDAGMGFCIFNNVAFGARYVQKEYGIKRVLIVDWDIHHGNGTQDIFYEDGTVFYMSTHKYGEYPMGLTGTGYETEKGNGEGLGANLNIALTGVVDDNRIVDIFKNKLLPKAYEFKPEFIIISTGFDSKKGDLLGGFDITDNGFKILTSMINELANKTANGRILSVLEGGYSLSGLSDAVHTHVEELLV